MAEKKTRKNKKKSIGAHGVAHIKSTFNNTHITLTDKSGNVVVWEKAGTSGFKGRVKALLTPQLWLLKKPRRLPCPWGSRA